MIPSKNEDIIKMKYKWIIYYHKYNLFTQKYKCNLILLILILLGIIHVDISLKSIFNLNNYIINLIKICQRIVIYFNIKMFCNKNIHMKVLNDIKYNYF